MTASSSQNLEKQRMAKRRALKTSSFQTIITIVTIIITLLAFIPIFLMLFLSLKNQARSIPTCGRFRFRRNGRTTTRLGTRSFATC